MQFSNLTILYFQVAAALLMGWDYFTPKVWRQYVDGALGRYFGGVQERVDSDLAAAWSYIKANLTRIIASLVSFALAYGVLKLGGWLGHSQPYVMLIIGLLFLLFISAGALSLINIVTPLLVPLGLGGVFKAVTKFLTTTERGPLAGLGFLALLVSFVMRYLNIHAT